MSVFMGLFYDIIPSVTMTKTDKKNNLRKSMKSALKSFSENKTEWKKLSFEVCRKFFFIQEFIEADVVFLYIPLSWELDCMPLVEQALKMGKKVAVPRCNAESCSMDFFYLSGEMPVSVQLEEGAFGIFEPKESLTKIELEKNCLEGKNIAVIVPGLAFSKDGKRLGKGKGFYDRYIPRLRRCGGKIFLFGVCFPFQITDDIPMEENDCFLNKVVF